MGIHSGLKILKTCPQGARAVCAIVAFKYRLSMPQCHPRFDGRASGVMASLRIGDKCLGTNLRQALPCLGSEGHRFYDRKLEAIIHCFLPRSALTRPPLLYCLVALYRRVCLSLSCVFQDISVMPCDVQKACRAGLPCLRAPAPPQR